MSEKIIDKNSSEQFIEDYRRYGMYITVRRTMPDYRDGLKPVQRRILWAMFNDSGAVNKTVKSASIIGDVMGKYHGHGDCLDADTILYSLDNTPHTIKELYETGVQEFNTLGVDRDGNVIPVIATHFRIGQYANKIYSIHLSNGAVVRCTANHPFLLNNLTWVKAEDITSGARLYSKNLKAKMDMKGNKRLYLGRVPLHEIVHDHYYGIPPEGYERHHKDFNRMNNCPWNLETINAHDHDMLHATENNDAAIRGLELGRDSMFGENGRYRELIKKKNSILLTEYTKLQGLRRFHYAIGILREEGQEITEENYEKLRGRIYNLPIIERLYKRYPEYGSTFEELVMNKPESVSHLFELRRGELDEYRPEKQSKPTSPIAVPYYNEMNGRIFGVLDRVLESGLELTVDNYYQLCSSTAQYKKPTDRNKLEIIIDLYKAERPYVEYVEVTDVPDTPMYDFTVEGYENILIPVRSQNNDKLDIVTGIDSMPLICVHNSSIYGTMKPMVNWFESYLPTIDKQGNFGNFQGHPASAYRYTEAKLSKFAIDCIIDELKANPKCVDWTPNFDNTLMEPEFLPVKVPLLLINGTFGIALGKRTEIPSHNTNEVIDATIALIRDPNADVTIIPDHCMKCEIVMTDFSTISRTGYGYYKVRGILDIEDYKGNKALVIKSTPNLLYLDDVSEKIDELIEKKKLVQVANCYDESSETDMRYVIVLRPGADPNYVRDVIYKETSLERTERINFEVLNGLEPIRMSYKSYLLSFIDHRKITKFRVYSNKLQAVQTRIHEKEIYIKVLESGEVDNIIAFIKKQKTVDDDYLINYLVKKLGITDLQAKFIINSDLRKLSIGYLNKYKEEIKGLTAERERYMSMVMDDHLIEAEIIAELEEIKAKYGKRRNCRVVKDRDRNEVPKGLMTVIVTEKNMIKKVPKGAPIGSFKGDTIKVIIEADNTDNVLIFDNLGKVYKLPISKIPFVETKSNGVDIRFLVKGLNADILSCIPERFTIVGSAKDNINRSYMVCLTRNGLIKKMDDSDFTNVPLSGIRYVKLDENDYVVSVRMADDSINFIAFSDRKAMLVPMDTVSNMKRNAKGNKTFKSDLADGLLEFYMNSCAYLLVITQNGRINKLPISGVPNLLIPRKAFSVIKLSKGDSIQNIIPVNENDTIEVTLMDSVMQLDVANYPVGSSISSGERAIPIRGNKILRTVKLLK